MNQNEIITLFEGYSEVNDDVIMKANCSVTLVKSKSKIILFDTLTAWDREILIQKLDENGVKPEQIDYLVCSHGHSDHVGNLNLFLNAQHFVGSCLNFKDSYFFSHDFENDPFELDEGVEVFASPGHTSSCISMMVKNSNIENGSCVAIVGDLFEKEEDVEHELIWLGAGSDNPEKQKENRLKVAKIADFIIPGHGRMFKVTNEMREKLTKDFSEKNQ